MQVRRPSPATVISVVALFVALGGTSYAALVVTSRNVKNESLTSADVRNGSLLRRDFKRGELPAGAPTTIVGSAGLVGGTGSQGPVGAAGPKGDTGAVGPQGIKGDTGAQGLQGDAGAPGLSGLQRVTVGSAAAASTTNHQTATAACPAGKRLVGTGAYPLGSGAGEVFITQIRPLTGSEQVSVAADEIPGVNPTWSVFAVAFCANAT